MLLIPSRSKEAAYVVKAKEQGVIMGVYPGRGSRFRKYFYPRKNLIRTANVSMFFFHFSKSNTVEYLYFLKVFRNLVKPIFPGKCYCPYCKFWPPNFYNFFKHMHFWQIAFYQVSANILMYLWKGTMYNCGQWISLTCICLLFVFYC